MRSSYWLQLSQAYDHSELVEMVSRTFGVPPARAGRCTTKSLREAMVMGSVRYLRTRGWN